MYRKKFMSAIERSERFGLNIPNIRIDEKTYITKERISELPLRLFNEFGVLTNEDLVCQCFYIHLKTKDFVTEIFGCPCYYTIGWVEINKSPLFYQNEDSLLSLLKNGINKPDVNLHVWLTLPSMEIIDFSLSTTVSKLQNYNEGLGGVIASHPSRLKDINYKPMIISEDFLFKIGAIRLTMN